jgi:hypothetical protein
VKLDTPNAEGVPEITPAVVNVNPAGRDPEITAQVYGAVPPVALSASGP